VFSNLWQSAKRKPREFGYKPISYDPDMKDFRDKVQERQKNSKRFDFRKHRQAENNRILKMQLLRFALVLGVLIFIAYLIFTSTAIDEVTDWFLNA
jgi:hypothetical protein